MKAFNLFPLPRSVTFGRSSFDFAHARWIIVAPSLSESLKAHVLTLGREIRELFARPLGVCAGRPESGAVLARILPVARSLGAQAYELTCTSEGITLKAGDEAGVFYGLQTLSQILGQCGSTIPECVIKDSPDFPARGVMLDISRCKVPTMETLEAMIDLFARLKINQVQLYSEHTFAFSAHETVWHDSSPVTAEEIIELDAYCRDRFIELVPNQNSFGHFERWLRHPEYRNLAECPDGFDYQWGGHSPNGSVLKPDDRSVRFLGKLYDELLPNFTSELLNVGCDETWELGKGWSKPLCEKQGTTQVYLDFLLKIHQQVRKRKHRMMFWGDIILHNPELVRKLPKDIIALEWGYESSHEFDKRSAHFAKAGVPFYVCPGTSSWNTLTGRTVNCLGNLMSAAKNGLKHGAIGYLNTDWGDGGHHQYLPISYTGFLAGAAYSWDSRANRDVDIVEALNRMVLGDSTGLCGSVLFELGKVPDILPERPSNKTVFNDLMFCSTDHIAGCVKNSRGPQVEKVIATLGALEERLLNAQPACADGSLVKAEIGNAIAMTRFAARRALGAFGKRCGAGDLRRELLHIIGTHEDLWLARNRRGGLHESSNRIRSVMNYL